MSLMPPSIAEKIRAYYPAGAAWLDELPGLIEQCRKRWELELLPAFEPGGESSWTAPVRRKDGTLAVLKLTVPMDHEHDQNTALLAWNGVGAIRLLEHDDAIRAQLLEHCEPATNAADLPSAEADAVAVQVLPQLWSAPIPVGIPPLPVQSRAATVRHRAERFAGQIDVGLFETAIRWYDEESVGPEAVLHGDFHLRNVLLSQRGWLAVDPMSSIGDPAYDVGNFLQYATDSDTRVDAMADAVGVPRDRARGWLLAMTVQGASWHLAQGDRQHFEALMETAARLG